jgi:hypothetical protein
VLPEDFEAVAQAKAFRDVEQAQRGCKGTMLQGLGLDAPLSVMLQQRLFVVKYFLQVPECATDDGSRPSAKETLMEAARARAAVRFWPSPMSDDDPDNLYPKAFRTSVPGQDQSRTSVQDIANNLWRIVKSDPGTYGGFETQKAADKNTLGRRLLHKLDEISWKLVPHAQSEACEELGAEPEDVELSLSNSEDSDDSE